MLVEVHMPERVALCVERIIMLTETEDGSARILFDGGRERPSVITCDESYEDVFGTLCGEEG